MAAYQISIYKRFSDGFQVETNYRPSRLVEGLSMRPGASSGILPSTTALRFLESHYILQAILENGSLRGMVFGYVAEIKIRNFLRGNGLVTDMVKDDDHDRKKKGDLRLRYRGHEFRLESKSLQTAQNKKLDNGIWVGVSQVDGSDKRTIILPDGSSITTTNLAVSEFDILSVNCFTFQGVWQFAFAKNSDLPRSKYRNYTEEQRQHLLATTVRVTWPPSGIFTDDLFQLLDELVVEAESKPQDKALIIKE